MKILKSIATFVGTTAIVVLAIALLADIIDKVKEINSLLSIDELDEE